MLKYCYKKWNDNKDKLEAALRETDLSAQSYKSLLALTVKHILNPGDSNEYYWDTDKIEVVDNGDYQGTLLFLIPKDTYQPSEYEYLMTYIGYGSCCCCDYLQSIQPWSSDEEVTDKDIKNFMGLCKDFVTNMIKPYNSGWREDDDFKPMTMEDSE
jgi:hypothetical protein